MGEASRELINSILVKLSDKVKDDELTNIKKGIEQAITDFEITKRVTEIAVYDQVPPEYKAYLVSKKIEGRSDGTIKLYGIYLKDMLMGINKSLNKIEANDVRVYLYKIKSQRDISDRSLESRRSIICGFFKWCTDEGYLTANPCATLKPIRYESKPRTPLTDIEMEKIRKACKTEREIAIIETLYSTGCRCSELCNLKIEDVDLENRQVRLFGKGKKHRTSYLSARAIVAITDYLKTRTDDDPYLFVSALKPIRRLNVAGTEVVVRKISKRAKILNVYPHRIRHTFATDALGRGMDIQDLKNILGHNSIDTTLIYAKINTNQISNSHRRVVI